MQSIIKPLRSIGFLTIALTLALAANFAYGQWANPTAAPTGGNVAPPVNTSATTQTKAGNFGAATMLAADHMRSPAYCDENGVNCLTMQEIIDGINGSNGSNGSNAVNDLVFQQHSSSQCASLGGEVLDIAGSLICRFDRNSCPIGWAQFQRWSTTDNRSCSGSGGYGCWGSGCTTGAHGWSDAAQESCNYRNNLRGGSDACEPTPQTCRAIVRQVGCY